MNSDREGVIPLDDEAQERFSIYFKDINLRIDLAKEIERLTNNWNELEEWLKSYISLFENPDTLEEQTLEDLKEVLDKMKEIKEGNNE